MAQTIAMQRGSQSVTCQGTNRYTLFTQSGGNATRVVINGLAIYASSSNSAGNWSIGLFIKNSGTSVYLPVAFKNNPGSANTMNVFLLPGIGANANTGAQRASTNDTISAVSLLGGNTNDWPNADNMILQGISSQVTLGNSTALYDYCPQNIWLGSGDALILSTHNPATLAATVAWNFTTITES